MPHHVVKGLLPKRWTVISVDHPDSTVSHDECQENIFFNHPASRRGRDMVFWFYGAVGVPTVGSGVPAPETTAVGAGVFVGGTGVGVGGSLGSAISRSRSLVN